MNTICMIRPPRVFLDGTFTAGASIPPLGMAYVNGSLEKASFSVYAIDAIGEALEQFYKFEDAPGINVQGMYLEDIVAAIPKDSFLIGLSCMFSSEWMVHEALIHSIKTAFPDVLIVIGGEHVTAESANILTTCEAVDICVSGEGELTMVELAGLIQRKGDWKTCEGISFRVNGHVVKNKSRARIKDINSIPLPSWKNIPLELYHEKGYSTTSVFRSTMPVLASRGCPFRCTFCTSPQMWGTELYLRDPKAVIEEVKSYAEKYKITHIEFLDIVGVLNKAWIKELLTLWIEAKLNLTWLLAAGTRSEILDDEVLELFKKSNVIRIMYAPESGSPETIKRIKKRIDLNKMMISMKKAHKLGISLKAPLLYGFPEQTLKEAFQSVWFSFKLAYIGVDDVAAHNFSAHPGTQLHNELVASGKIRMDYLIHQNQYHQFLTQEAVAKVRNLHSWSEHIPSWSLPFFQHGVMFVTYMISFTFHPSKFFRALKRTFYEKAPLTLFEHILYDMFVSKRVKQYSAPRILKSYYKNSEARELEKVS